MYGAHKSNDIRRDTMAEERIDLSQDPLRANYIKICAHGEGLPEAIPAVRKPLEVILKSRAAIEARHISPFSASETEINAFRDFQSNHRVFSDMMQQLATSTTSKNDAYLKFIQLRGNDFTIENVMMAMMKAAYVLISDGATENGHLLDELRDEMENLKRIRPSNIGNQAGSFQHLGSGDQFNNTGSGPQHNNTGGGNQFIGGQTFNNTQPW